MKNQLIVSRISRYLILLISALHTAVFGVMFVVEKAIAFTRVISLSAVPATYSAQHDIISIDKKEFV